ncbi:MAG: tetratricopeptide repeat protein [Sporichthyaceae bacterium]|nr:tetratricopeptide repeat protein [Sporichthyaceae bacterium]
MAGVAEHEVTDPAVPVERIQTLEELGEALRQLRRRHARRQRSPELTVRELARRSGYAYGVISEYLSGKSLAPTDRFDVLIRLLGASAREQRALATARDRVEEQRRVRRPGGTTAAPGGFGVPRELPPDVYGFTGRQAELTALDEGLDRTIAAVTGTAGVGKTALAVHWSHRVGAGFPDGCLYVDLRGYDPDQPMTAAEALAGFLRSLGVSGTDIPPTAAERTARYRTLLADRRMLVLLDNARDTEHARPLLPGGSGCMTLVTSRDALTGLIARHGAHRIELEPLTRCEAVDLLEVLVGSRVRDDLDAAATLADRCVRLPLTLRLVAELAGTRSGATLAELDAELADLRQRLHRLDAGGEPRTASHTVFSWSYQNLAPNAARAFRMFGLHPGHDLDEFALAALSGVKLGRARMLLADLAKAHLIQVVRPHRYGMHDLLRAYAIELAGQDPADQRRAALSRLADQQLFAAASAMGLVAPFDRERRPAIADPGWPAPPLADADDAVRWLDLERPNLIATALHAAEHGRPEHSGKLAAILLRYLDTGAHYHDAEQLYRHVADSPVPTDQAHALTSLGTVCWRLGRYQEAACHHERALELARTIDSKSEQGRALLMLGIVYWHLGRTELTLECGQQTLELYRELGDRLGQARVLGNLGIVHGQLGNYPAALDYHRRALAIFRDIGDPAGIGNELCGLGYVLTYLGRGTDALRYLTDALNQARQAGYRESEAEILNNLGAVYLRLGQLAEALDNHQQALDLTRRIGDRTTEGYSLGHLGTVHERRGQYRSALDHHRQALRIAGEIGDNHVAAELLNRLGDTLLAAAEPAQALRAYRRALSKTGEHGNRYQQARAHHGLARSLCRLGKAEAAGPHWARAARQYAELGVPEADQIRIELDQVTVSTPTSTSTPTPTPTPAAAPAPAAPAPAQAQAPAAPSAPSAPVPIS